MSPLLPLLAAAGVGVGVVCGRLLLFSDTLTSLLLNSV